MNKPKVLFITTSFPRYRGDSAGIFVWNFLERIKLIIDCQVLAPAHPKCVENFTDYPVHLTKYWFNQGQDVFYGSGGVGSQIDQGFKLISFIKLVSFLVIQTYRSLIMSRHFDFIHVQWIQNALFAILPKLIFGKRFFVTVRGSDMVLFQRSAFIRFIFLPILSKSSAIFCVNKEMLDSLKSFSALRKVKIVLAPDGVEQYQRIEPIKTPPSKILFVGNLIEIKGLDLLAKALSSLKLKSKIEIYFIGDGHLKTLFEQNLPNVEYYLLGRLPNGQVIHHMLNSDLLVLPSRREGRPTVVLEAIGCQLPVLATRLPGLLDILNDDEIIYFNTGSSQSLTEELLKIINGEFDTASFAERAQQKILSLGLTWDKCVEIHLECYGI